VLAQRHRHAETRWWVDERSSRALLRVEGSEPGGDARREPSRLGRGPRLPQALRHGQSRSESVAVENAHHQEPDSPIGSPGNREAPMGELPSRTVKGAQRVTNRPDAKPVGRLAVVVREPPCPHHSARRIVGLSQRRRSRFGASSCGQGRSRSMRRSSTTRSSGRVVPMRRR
jgi:hypothetical protein